MKRERRGFFFRKLLIAAAGVSLLALGVLASGVKAVGIYSPDLQLAAFGYHYQGRPLTGIVYELYPKYRLAKFSVLFKGKRHGPEIHWYDNGQRWVERHYRDGLEVGIHRAWYPDGGVKYLKSFSDDGLPHGEFFTWHGNGRLSDYLRYDHGKEIVAKSWTGGGKPFYNYIWRDGYRVGLQGDTYCEPRRKSN